MLSSSATTAKAIGQGVVDSSEGDQLGVWIFQKHTRWLLEGREQEDGEGGIWREGCASTAVAGAAERIERLKRPLAHYSAVLRD
jgi:hypothetical protein